MTIQSRVEHEGATYQFEPPVEIGRRNPKDLTLAELAVIADAGPEVTASEMLELGRYIDHGLFAQSSDPLMRAKLLNEWLNGRATVSYVSLESDDQTGVDVRQAIIDFNVTVHSNPLGRDGCCTSDHDPGQLRTDFTDLLTDEEKDHLRSWS